MLGGTDEPVDPGIANPDGTNTGQGTAALTNTGPGKATLSLSGSWIISGASPDTDEIASLLANSPELRALSFDCSSLIQWDSTFIVATLDVLTHCERKGIKVSVDALPAGAQRLINLATAVPERQGARRDEVKEDFLTRVGKSSTELIRDMMKTITFLGEATIALGRCATGSARFRRVDLWVTLQDCGPSALPIVTLISVLIGLILAFVGAVQLQQFGAQIYVADLVAIAMAREMAAIMTGIIMSGRTGAAFAAQLGTMQVNEEIDAFKTLGFSPMEFLVLPRMLALIVMMPLLCIYANVLGILGGAVVGVGMIGLTPTEYYIETINGVDLVDFAIGIAKSVVFGMIVAVSGCLKGIESGRSASAVGEAATSAVVMSIVLIIVFDGIFAVLTQIVGI